MKVECQVCHQFGYLQKIGQGYYRIRHYDKIVDGKSTFHYHQQTKEYIQSLHIDLSNNKDSNNIEHLNTPIDLKLKATNLNLDKAGGVGFEPTTTDLGGRCSIQTNRFSTQHHRLSYPS